MNTNLSAGQKIQMCPDTPNCVSSLEAEKESHKLGSFPIIIDFTTSKKVILDIIGQLPRTKLVEQQKDYLHFTFTSLVFRFVDDVEFEYDQANNIINVRSASRVGYSDLGVNRRRIEELRELYLDKMKNFKVASSVNYK